MHDSLIILEVSLLEYFNYVQFNSSLIILKVSVLEHFNYVQYALMLLKVSLLEHLCETYIVEAEELLRQLQHLLRYIETLPGKPKISEYILTNIFKWIKDN